MHPPDDIFLAGSGTLPDAPQADPTSLLRRILALDAELLQRQEQRGGSAGGTAAPSGLPAFGGADPQPWPLALDPAGEPASLGLYERRPDDAAIIAARESAAFFASLGAAPDPAMLQRSAAALAGAPGVRRPTEGPPDVPVPDMSIIVPVHGQLAHTLNCLAGLLGHVSRRRFEVLIVDDASPDGSGRVLADLAAAVADLSVLHMTENRGFIAACNAGAAAARGRLLVLLNNDTRVVAGWLDALADGFDRWPRAGLVGSKLLYPDGRLQECGGLVWRDGSAWNFGRNQDPNHPAFCHARQVDYVSGASIAVPAALWRALGGLDAHFSPAYSEDTDLAMRLRAAGHEVWVQPASRVIHHEGGTGGTDLTAGVKVHQVVNLKKFFVRWQDALVDHARPGSDPWLARDRLVRRRALVIDASTPTPNEDAGSGVTVETICLLQNLGYAVHFVPQDNFLFQPGPTGALQAAGVQCAYAPYDVSFPEFIARHGAQFDLIVVFRPAVLAAVLADLRRCAPQAPIVFSNADLHFLRHAREAAVTRDRALAARVEREKAEELALIAAADVTFTLSTHERDVLARELPDTRVVVQPYPQRLVGTSAGFEDRQDFLFLGGYRHPPNVDAAAHFVRDVLPLIRRSLPQARAIIAGANPTDALRALAGPGVEVRGYVADLPGLLDQVRVFVCPLRYGAGVKGKVFMALAHGLPVVATPCGAEGAGLVDGQTLLVADGAAEFAAACCRLHEDPRLWAALSQAGMAHVALACADEAGEQALRAAIDTAWRRKLGLD